VIDGAASGIGIHADALSFVSIDPISLNVCRLSKHKGATLPCLRSITKLVQFLCSYTDFCDELCGSKVFSMVMSRDQNAGRSHNMKINNSSIERVEEFKYLVTTVTDQNYIQEEIKSRLKRGNARYFSVQNLLSTSLLSKNLKIKIYSTIFLSVFCMSVKLGR
jgi:hypothetical protein